MDVHQRIQEQSPNYQTWVDTRMCLRKRSYSTHLQARRACALSQLSLGVPFRFYQCPRCQQYHVTKRLSLAVTPAYQVRLA